jgi:hypothetical protein
VNVAPYRVHRLIQDINRDPKLAASFVVDPEPVFEQYGLAENERHTLRECTPQALMTLGIHPNLQMKLLRFRSAARQGGPGPLSSYLRDLGLEP